MRKQGEAVIALLLDIRVGVNIIDDYEREGAAYFRPVRVSGKVWRVLSNGWIQFMPDNDSGTYLVREEFLENV